MPLKGEKKWMSTKMTLMKLRMEQAMIFGNSKKFKGDSNVEIKEKRKDMPAVDKLTVGKREAVVERRKSTKQPEDAAYKSKMKKDSKKKDC
jgi:hypothetical protein